MIGCIDIEVQAHNPQFPLHPLNAYINSPSSIRLRNVPKKIGDWKIEKVYAVVKYPNGEEVLVETKLVGGVYVGTFKGCDVSGTSTKGFIVKADGVDENNNAVEGYVLGVGDVYILDNDGRIAPQELLKVVNIVSEKSSVPHIGDALWVDGTFQIYDGVEWKNVGSGVVESKIHPGHAEYADEAEWAQGAWSAENANFANGVEWENVRNKPTIPTKTSELQNDSGYTKVVESSDVPGYAENSVYANSAQYAVNADNADSAVNSQNASYATNADTASFASWAGNVEWDNVQNKPDIPTKTSELENDSGFLDGSDKDELNERIDLIQATSHPNMNVIGSPTFNQGSVGGFSQNDYLMFPTSVNVGQNNVQFHMSFTTGNNVSVQENILDSWCGLALAIQNGHFILAASSNGTTFNVANGSSIVLANTSYDIKITFSYGEGLYNIILLVNDVLDARIRMDAPLFATSTYWGGANPSSGANHIFGGTINLNECWMSWNGEVVWRGYSELPIPTKVSQLENDSGYATQDYVDSQIGESLEDEY